MHVLAPTLLRHVALAAPLFLVLGAAAVRAQGRPPVGAQTTGVPQAAAQSSPAPTSAASGSDAESAQASGAASTASPVKASIPVAPGVQPAAETRATSPTSTDVRPASSSRAAPARTAVHGPGGSNNSAAIVPHRRKPGRAPPLVPDPTTYGQSRWRIAGAAELGVQPLALSPSEADVFFGLTPILSVGFDGVFALELGAPLRVAAGAIVGVRPMELRREDWDERSDFGQLVRGLRIGRETDAFSLWAGPLTLETLGRGALVSRYGNRMLATQSPAGARLRAEAGPVRTEVLASDVLALRLLAGEVRLDGGHLFTGSANGAGHWHVTLGAAHDAGQVEARSDPITLASLEVDAVFVRLSAFQLAAFMGGGARLGEGGGNLGGQAGLELEAQLPSMVFGGRFAGRYGGGGYRSGFFGADHELARLSGQGLTTAPLADLQLPPGYSGYGLVQLGFGAQGEEEVPLAGATRGTASIAFEVFQSGRTDLEAAYQLDLLAQGLSLAGRLGASGLGQTPRSWISLEGRGRLSPSIYLLAAGGTTFAPREGGGLTRGWTATAGVGFDFDARP